MAPDISSVTLDINSVLQDSSSVALGESSVAPDNSGIPKPDRKFQPDDSGIPARRLFLGDRQEAQNTKTPLRIPKPDLKFILRHVKMT